MSPPVVELSHRPLTEVADASVLAVPVLDGDEVALGPGAAALEELLGVDLLALEPGGCVGDLTPYPVPGGRDVLLVGVGGATPAELRRAGAVLARAVRERDMVATSLGALDGDPAGLRALAEGLVLGSFGFTRRSAGPQWLPVRRVVLSDVADGPDQREALRRGVVAAGASWLSRTLALTPSNEKSPAWLAAQAQRLGEEHGLAVRVWDEQQLAAEGFGGLLAVGSASATPPRLVQLGYRPRPKRVARGARHVVLVGKGITFDSGGLSIKPREAMVPMKRDMTGAGSVLAAMVGCAQLGLPVRVTGLLACAENAVGGAAMRPGDVLRHYGGRTTEVTNTDAEGRLVMADALAYAVERLEPDVLVDVATLTGAVKIALGQTLGGLFATDDELGASLLEAGEASGEPLWRLPLLEEYDDRLASTIADAVNHAAGPGTILAALFLHPFAGGVPWAHLDIASVGDSPQDAFEYTLGATGFGARVLLEWLASPYVAASS